MFADARSQVVTHSQCGSQYLFPVLGVLVFLATLFIVTMAHCVEDEFHADQERLMTDVEDDNYA
jgi:hypothetical protein